MKKQKLYPGNQTYSDVHRGVRYTVFGRCAHRQWPWEWYADNGSGSTMAGGGAGSRKVAEACAKAAIDVVLGDS